MSQRACFYRHHPWDWLADRRVVALSERRDERAVASERAVELADRGLDSFGLAVTGAPNEKDDAGSPLDAFGDLLRPLPQSV
ncbi:hypothetical protein V5F77_27650 [Xanthobacter sp. DSM 24535]|uniref:hypothetical protein n=1 Tax=Roseixanthobacter psychrophilus TaxID=3119917 RepID=UPI00372CB484